MAESSVSVRLLDYSREVGSFGFRIADLSVPGNVTAYGTNMTNFLLALQAVTGGAQQGTTVVFNRTKLDVNPPNNAEVQREKRWLVRYQDTVTRKMGSFEVPTAMLNDAYMSAHTDFANLSKTEWQTFVTAAEAVVLSGDGNPIHVVSIEFVPRRG